MATRTQGPWELVPNYGFGQNANRVEFWHAKRIVDGRTEVFADERGVKCFDYPDLAAAIAKAAA